MKSTSPPSRQAAALLSQSPPKDLKPLSESEKESLNSCELVIQKNLVTFLEVGRALLQIQQEKLYRESYRSFEEYCRAKWHMGRYYAYRQIQAAKVVEGLLTSCQHTLPTSEGQVRPLVGLEPEKANAVWSEAVAVSGSKVNARLVEAAKKRLLLVSNGKSELAETWRINSLEIVKQLQKALRSGSQAEAQLLANRLNLILAVGTHTTNEHAE